MTTNAEVLAVVETLQAKVERLQVTLDAVVDALQIVGEQQQAMTDKTDAAGQQFQELLSGMSSGGIGGMMKLASKFFGGKNTQPQIPTGLFIDMPNEKGSHDG